ncbi:hypothetical protein [Maribacter sp. 2307ULW6-5]|uniref:hypothetical protein n=1 Tax=Maribacter sp. 2307ULW6-5 TaxID=3386275 RepID=UPI0039BCB42C
MIQELKGGSFSSFKLKGHDINPFDWSLKVSQQPEVNKGGFDFRGHFISLGTWGLPTKNEQRAGIRLYGEPSAQVWTSSTQKDLDGNTVATTGFKSQIEGLNLERSIVLYKNEALVKVVERVTNTLPIGRVYNFLQHPSFGGTFVSDKLLIDTNAGKGFYQKGDFPRHHYENLELFHFNWPNGELPKDSIDLRKTGQLPNTYLTSHIFDDNQNMGWATATNLEHGIMVGYLWETKHYPWLNVWHQYKNGKVRGRALEFATCGIGLGFEELMTKDHRFFEHPSFEFIDADETTEKSYYLFMLEVYGDFIGTNGVSLTEDGISVDYLTSIGKKKKFFSF